MRKIKYIWIFLCGFLLTAAFQNCGESLDLSEQMDAASNGNGPILEGPVLVEAIYDNPAILNVQNYVLVDRGTVANLAAIDAFCKIQHGMQATALAHTINANVQVSRYVATASTEASCSIVGTYNSGLCLRFIPDEIEDEDFEIVRIPNFEKRFLSVTCQYEDAGGQ